MNGSTGSGDKEEKKPTVPEPDNMVRYDPDRPLYGHRHVCVLLRKVSDALNGYTTEDPGEDPYD